MPLLKSLVEKGVGARFSDSVCQSTALTCTYAIKSQTSKPAYNFSCLHPTKRHRPTALPKWLSPKVPSVLPQQPSLTSFSNSNNPNPSTPRLNPLPVNHWPNVPHQPAVPVNLFSPHRFSLFIPELRQKRCWAGVQQVWRTRLNRRGSLTDVFSGVGQV